MTNYNQGFDSRLWPEPIGFLSRIKDFGTPYRHWDNVSLSDSINLIGAYLHSKNYIYDHNICYFEVIFSSYYQIKYFEMVGYGRGYTHIISYEYDEITEFIDREIKTQKNPFKLFKIGCHISGDIWLAEEH